MARLADLTDSENAFLGGSAALIEGVLLQPTMYAKNARAQGLPLTLDPRVLYRGIGAALCNEMLQLGLQFSAAGALARRIPNEIAASASAGALVAIFASPLELVMIQQQRFGGSLTGTARMVVAKHGFGSGGLGRGLGLAMGRDAIYVGSMLGVTPWIQRLLLEWRSTQGPTQEALASLAASMLGGVVGALLSHPLDVIKTCQQGDLPRSRYGSVLATIASLLRDGGYARLLHGASWRTLNITATVWIANECSIHLPAYVTAITRQ